MNKQIIRVATFNLFNLVLPNQEYYDNKKYSSKDYDQKIDWIGRKLRTMNADIAGFQEIFHEEAFREALEKSGNFEQLHYTLAPCNGSQPVVGFASRYPIVENSIINDFPEEGILSVKLDTAPEPFELPFKTFSRGILRAKVQFNDNTFITFYVVHLKSKRPIFIGSENRDNPVHLAKARARSLMVRAAEATALRALLMKDLQSSENPVVVMGDVNDSGMAVTSKIVSGEPPHRRWPMEVKKKIWDVMLYHVKDIQARRSYADFYYTHIHNGHYESLDHIMVSQELVAENPNHVGKVGYVSNYNDHLIDETLSDERIPSWASDHGMVCATIELGNSRPQNQYSKSNQ